MMAIWIEETNEHASGDSGGPAAVDAFGVETPFRFSSSSSTREIQPQVWMEVAYWKWPCEF